MKTTICRCIDKVEWLAIYSAPSSEYQIWTNFRYIEKIKVNELIRKLVISEIIANLPNFEIGGNWSLNFIGLILNWQDGSS